MSNTLVFDFTVDKAAKTVNITREFDAALSLVWDAFTKADLLDQWLPPHPMTAKTKYQNFQVGGKRFYAMLEDNPGCKNSGKRKSNERLARRRARRAVRPPAAAQKRGAGSCDGAQPGAAALPAPPAALRRCAARHELPQRPGDRQRGVLLAGPHPGARPHHGRYPPYGLRRRAHGRARPQSQCYRLPAQALAQRPAAANAGRRPPTHTRQQKWG
nr:hypothetical protein [Tanacetum cinerariifolium]